MALTYAEQNQIAAFPAWQARVRAAVADVALTQIKALVDTDPNATILRNLAAAAVADDTLLVSFCRLVAAGLPVSVTLGTPTVDLTATDAQIKAQVRTAFDQLALRR